MDVQKEINELRRKLNYYGKLYYVDDAPAISDYEYDMLMQQLKALEKEHPELVTPDSPTQRIGGPALSKFEPVYHQVPLESLTDVFSVDELFAFGERMGCLCLLSTRTEYLSAARPAATALPVRTLPKTSAPSARSRSG